MRFEAKKKELAVAISQVRAVATSLEVESGSSPALRLKASKKTLKVASLYAEATVADVTVEEDGEAVVDMQSIQQALGVSGDKFKFRLDEGNSSAQFWCGRSKGPVSLHDAGFNGEVLADAPKTTIHVPGLKDLLSSLALKGLGGKESDRSLHFDPKNKVIRGESSDSLRGVVVNAKVTGDDTFKAAALSLPQKACDAIAKLVSDAVVGFDDNFFVVRTPGLFVVIPLTSDPPLELLSQVVEWTEAQKNLGYFTVAMKEAKSALDDVLALLGPNLSDPQVDLSLSGTKTAAKFEGNSESGEIESDLVLTEAKLKAEFSMNFSPVFLKECLNFYKDDVVKITVRDGALLLDKTSPSDWIESQLTIIPLNQVIDDVEIQEEAEEEPAPKAKASKKVAKKPAPEPEPEPDPEEEDEEPAAPPAKKAGKKAKKPKPAPEPEPEEEEEEAPDEDDEDFDEEPAEVEDDEDEPEDEDFDEED